MEVRTPEPDELDAATETIALAFAHDPVWGVALAAPSGRRDHLRPYWRLFLEGALRYDTVFVGPEVRTVSVWIPPGGSELSDEQEGALFDLVGRALGPEGSTALGELWARFEENHPHEPSHAYLSLLGTRPDLSGRGLGQAHLAADLSRWDAAGVPTYLESSNPANDHRYARQGYVPRGRFHTVLDGAVVTTMWRPVGG